MVTVADILLHHSSQDCTCNQDGNKKPASKVEGAAGLNGSGTVPELQKSDRVVYMTNSGPSFGTVLYKAGNSVGVKFVSTTSV